MRIPNSFKILADGMGATIDNNSTKNVVDVVINAPDGKRWACDQVHLLVGHQYQGFSTKELFQDLIDRMNYGLENCPHDCECMES